MKHLSLIFLATIPIYHAVGQNPADRYALVIGVKDYAHVQPLKNSINDAQDMAAVLKSKGFTVQELYNPKTKRDMQDAIRVYFNLLNGNKNATGIVFYSGHSMQVKGINYFMPTTSNPQLEADLDDQALKMEYLLAAVEQAGNPLNVFILDACRNNPFRSFTRSAEQGLNQVNAPKGSYVVYATAPGSVASDGIGRNGLFTSKLLKYINTPDIALEQVFKYVARDVQQESQGSQIPWINYSYFGDFSFDRNITTRNPATTPVTANTIESKPEYTAQQMVDKGLEFFKNKEYAEAVSWYRKAAEQGTDVAQFNLGLMYEVGRGVTQNDAEAVSWYRKAAEQGNASGQLSLGSMYAIGRGVTQNYAGAVSWFRKSAEQGNADAQYHLGLMYENIRGIKDKKEAIRWYKKAADQKNEKAVNRLRELGVSGY